MWEAGGITCHCPDAAEVASPRIPCPAAGRKVAGRRTGPGERANFPIRHGYPRTRPVGQAAPGLRRAAPASPSAPAAGPPEARHAIAQPRPRTEVAGNGGQNSSLSPFSSPSMLAWLICLAIAWGAVFLLCGCDKEKRGRGGPLGSVTAETRLKQHLGLIVPDSARNVKCHVEALMVMWVYARLDVPHSDLAGLLLQAPLNRLPRPSKNPDVLRELQVNASEIAWWPKSADGNVAVSQSTWRKPGKSSDWECTLSLRLDEQTERVVLYVQYSEEPVSRSGSTGK